jgi:putative tricarboxylic transport membrane protein
MFGYPTVPLVLGLVLGRLLETSFYQSLAISAGDWTVFFTRPLSASMLGIAAVVIFLPLIGRLRRIRPLQRSEGAA